jgi:hypothetical protein
MDKILVFSWILSYSDHLISVKERKSSDYNAVYNYLIKKSACQGVFRKKLKKLSKNSKK